MDKYNLDLYEKIRNLQDTFNQEDYHDYQNETAVPFHN